MVDADFRNSYDQGYRDALSDLERAIEDHMIWFHMRESTFFAEQLTKRIRTLRQASSDRKAETE